MTVSKRRILILIATLVAAGAFAFWRFGFARPSDADRLVLHGNIELTEVDMSFKASGRLVELAVDEGDPIKQGQTLAQLDREELDRQRDRERSGIQSAGSALTQLHTSIDFQKESIAGDSQLKKAELDQAQARLAELLNGSRTQEVQQASAAVDEARSQNDQAQRDWERAQSLFKNEDISASQFDQYRMRAQSTAAALKRAQESYALIKEGPRREQIDGARAQVDRARAALRLAEANRLDLKRREEEIVAREAEIARTRSQVAVLDTQLKDRQLISPIDGVVLTKTAEVGEVLAAGATLFTLGDIDRPWVRGYIPERSLGRIKLGMPVDVRTDSFPGKTYSGKVTFIASEAEFTPKTIQTPEERVKLVYRIKVHVENPNRELKLNMPVDAEIRFP
jgi:HlyD family secretion protein